MKRLIFFVVLTCGLVSQNFAQSINFEMLKAPCNKDGILKANFVVNDTATLIWYYNGKSVTRNGYFATSDTIFDWGGGPVSLAIQNANGGTMYGGYKSDLPFGYTIEQTLNICPIPSMLEVKTTGGTPPFSYEWYDVGNGNNALIGTTNPINVGSGKYSVVVTDANGCVQGGYVPGSQPGQIYVEAPVGFTYEVVSTDANCANGTLSVQNISGGQQPFSFLWSNGATSQSLNNLKSGNFQLTITDAQGCSAVEYEAYVAQAYDIPVNITNTPTTCSNTDGAAIAFASGGTPPYSYSWTNGANTQQISNLASGSYQVVVTDAGGCTGQGSTYLASISPVVVSIAGTKPSSCSAATGSAEISVSGGTAPYTISWSTFPQQTGTKLVGVPPGQYVYSVKDNAGCIRTGSILIQPESVLNADFKVNPAECTTATGKINLTVSGGTSPYIYSWNTGNTTTQLDSLPSGVYVVTVTDAKSCKLVKAVNVGKTSPLSAGFSTVPASCIFSADGSAQATVFNGTPPYDFIWSNGAKTSSVDSLKTGKYTLFIKDALGCLFDKQITVGYDASGDDCYCILEGNVYHDANDNCLPDNGEKGLKNIQLYCSGVGYTYTDSLGNYSFKVPSGNYTLTEYDNVYYPISSCQSKSYSVTAVAGSACRMSFNFANTVKDIHDVRIGLWNVNIPVPGFKYSQNLIVTNDGTMQENNIIASYKNDNQIGVPAFLPNILNTQAPGYFTNNTFFNLKPGESQKISIDYTVPANIPLNTDLYFTDSTSTESPMSTWLNDFTPWNNVNQRHVTVLSSYDPNFIEVSPQGFGDKGYITQQDSVLEYMVHFQNLGNYFATTVKVDVFLDSNLQWQSVRPVYSSAPSQILLSENGVLSYTFDNIHLLPASWNEQLSHGAFSFTIRQKPELIKGTEIRNFADIYFDYNPAVTTNKSLNTIDYRLDAPGQIATDVVSRIYPNPAGKTLYIELKSQQQGDVNVSLFDLYGRHVLSRKFQVPADRFRIETDQLSNGMYFMEISAGNNSRTLHKIVIERD